MDDNLLSELSSRDIDDLQLELGRFIVSQNNARPICLVTSGGTAADLEKRCVRSLDNFSTGLRGAISVEEFLKRGYAVIHLWRIGSAAPYARVLSQYLGLQQSNHGLNVECLSRLFVLAGEDTEADMVQTVLEQEKDPWMTTNGYQNSVANQYMKNEDIILHRGVLHNASLKKALTERARVLSEGRLLTVPFRTVDEYLAKLQICAEKLSVTKSLGAVFLAAAVSDFYIPRSERAEHKIQSRTNENGLILNLRPVPKVMGLLRKSWAPDAFVVSFKLETDEEILRHKAENAVEKYGCHLVIGNLLQSRHKKVSVLHPEIQDEKVPRSAKAWEFTEFERSSGADADSLESSLVDFVVQSHFEFISWHFNPPLSGIGSMQEAHQLLRAEKKRVKNELFWKKAKSLSLEIAGAVFALCISYTINSALQKRRS
jgi:phosphopantothenate-cysteine ligase